MTCKICDSPLHITDRCPYYEESWEDNYNFPEPRPATTLAPNTNERSQEDR